MLNTFKNEYLKLYRESKEQQWDNYFEGLDPESECRILICYDS